MPFNPQTIDINDLDPNIGLGIDLPFTGSGTFNLTFNTQEAIKNNLINYFLTEPGERPLNPSFGGGLRVFIFQQITTNNLDFLEERISNDLGTFFPNVAIGNLEILKQEDTNTITVSLTYSVVNTNISDTLEIDFT